uniref:Venom peptide n=1 Tax=Comana monomorpha TaxID=1555636 RepID=A0AAU6PAZ8_9NEOP
MSKYFLLFLSFTLLVQVAHFEHCIERMHLGCIPDSEYEVLKCCAPYTCDWHDGVGRCLE